MKRLIIGLSGASGAIYGIRLLEAIREKVESHLVITESAKDIITQETSYSVEQVAALASKVYDNTDLSSTISSGSFLTDGMVILPCSIKTLSSIAYSYTSSLLSRAADVTLKEKRRLIVCVRETPMHLGHVRLMARVAEIGGIIFPPIPAFYYRPESIDDIVNHTVGKVLDLLSIDHSLYNRWDGTTQ